MVSFGGPKLSANANIACDNVRTQTVTFHIKQDTQYVRNLKRREI